MVKHEEYPRNDLLDQALRRLAKTQAPDDLLAVYEAIQSGILWVGYADGAAPGTVAEEGVRYLATTTPDEQAPAFLAFTDIEELQKRAPGIPGAAIGSDVVLEAGLTEPFEGLVINPES